MTSSRLALAIAVIGTTVLSAATAPAQDTLAPDRPVRVNGRPVVEVQGVWRSRGYGYIVNINGDGHQLFHVAGEFCYPDVIDQSRAAGAPSGLREAVQKVRSFVRRHLGFLLPRRDPDGMFGLYRMLGPTTIAFSAEPEETRYVFDRLQELPAVCTDPTPWNAPRIAGLVAATFAEIYPSFEQRGIDWPARTAAALAALDASSNDDVLYRTLQTMLSGIDDPHVELQARIDGQPRELMLGEGATLSRVRAAIGNKAMRENEWLPAYRDGVLNVVLQGRGHETANQRLFWGLVGDIGYINLLSMERLSRSLQSSDESALDRALDEAIAALSGARAVIFDVSYNLGGYDAVSRHVAARFADRRRLAFTKVGFGARDVEPQPVYVEPSPRPRYLGPVYLLTSDATVSAGETFTLFMRALPNVVHVGRTTRGGLSDLLEKPLPNGWELALAGDIYLDPNGENYEARGIPPYVEFEVFPPDELIGGHARRVLALIEEIRQREPGGPLGAAGAPSAR